MKSHTRRLGARQAANRPQLTHQIANRPRRADLTTQAGFLSVYAGQTYLGFLLPCGKGVDFDADDRSLGIFENMKAAADAVSEAS